MSNGPKVTVVSEGPPPSFAEMFERDRARDSELVRLRAENERLRQEAEDGAAFRHQLVDANAALAAETAESARLRGKLNAVERYLSEERAAHAETREALTREKAEAAINERLRGLLGRWLQWEGRSTDDTTPLETETAKVLGHSDDCELVEYGVCTCALAAPPAPVAAPKCERYEEDHGDYSVRFHCKNCGEHVGRHLNASQFITPAAAPAPPAVPPVPIARAICTHPGYDNDGKCHTCGDKVALGVPMEFARFNAAIDAAIDADQALRAPPPAVPDKCGYGCIGGRDVCKRKQKGKGLCFCACHEPCRAPTGGGR